MNGSGELTSLFLGAGDDHNGRAFLGKGQADLFADASAATSDYCYFSV
jgi:hypothetical protein